MRLLRRGLGSSLWAGRAPLRPEAGPDPPPCRRRSRGSRRSAADLSAARPYAASARAALLRGGSAAPSVARNSNPADRIKRIAPTNSNVYALWASARASS